MTQHVTRGKGRRSRKAQQCKRTDRRPTPIVLIRGPEIFSAPSPPDPPVIYLSLKLFPHATRHGHGVPEESPGVSAPGPRKTSAASLPDPRIPPRPCTAPETRSRCGAAARR